LPYGTPAYFLASYSGPTAGLIKQFNAALQGLGAGDWDHVSSESSHSPTFIVGWIKVENKQGEDKGLTIIYPTKLCLSYLPFSSSRVHLDYIPDLPAPLQPSPPASKYVSASIQSVVRQPSFITSPTSESLYSFRALTLASKDLKQVTAEVGGYIDEVARERERERERLRRERESGVITSPKTAQSSMTPVTTAVASVDPSTSIPAPAPSQTIPSQAPQPIPTPTPLPTGVQTFYPSPPQTDPSFAPSSEVKTSPTIPSNTLDVPSNIVPATETLSPTATRLSDATSFHSYDMDPTWSQPADDFLGMDINNMDFVMDDMGLNFSLHMGPMANDSSTVGPSMTPYNSGGNAANTSAGMEFEDAFTDDDFSFFDQPSKPSAPPQLQHIHNRSTSGSRTMSLNSHTGSTLSSRISPPNICDAHRQHSASTAQMWTPGGLMDGFSPLSLTNQTDSLPPELVPSSPGQTAESQSIPATPNMHLEFDTFVKRCVSSSGCPPGASASLFEPIPFAPYHRQADGKYSFGKFALPTPPAEDVEFPPEVSSISLPASPSGFTLRSSWRVKYDAATDPRIGVVKKLIGVKRKFSSIATIWDNPQKKANITQHDWEGRREDAKCEESDPESEEDGEDMEDNDSMNISRPMTPPPSYLPLGPTLLNTHFHHSYLLPLSVPLRSPGAAIDSLNLASNNYNPPLSVPTPVSPAATMGAASEKSRSLEAAALAIATEVVGNPVWAEAWRANAVGAKGVGAVWSTDIRTIKELMQHVPGLEAPLSMAELFGLTNTVPDDSSVTSAKEINTTTLQLLEVPMLSIGKGEAIIKVLPPALRFWEKLGLTPKGGRKDITAFALFEDDGRRQSLMENWLKSVKNSYQVCLSLLE